MQGYKGIPGWAPSSITCNLETICPALVVFEAKQIRIESLSFPAICFSNKDEYTNVNNGKTRIKQQTGHQFCHTKN